MNRFIFLLVAGVMMTWDSQAQMVLKVNEMNLTNAYQEYGGVAVGQSVTGEKAMVAGVEYPEAVGVHAKSVIKIDTRRNVSRFKGKVGVADSKIDYSNENITAIPLTDGKKLYYNIEKNSKTFVGLEGKSGKVEKGSVVFSIVGDGKELFNSGVVSYGAKPVDFEVALNRVRVLELIVEEGADGPSGDHAL